jgi:hypothetical protein
MDPGGPGFQVSGPLAAITRVPCAWTCAGALALTNLVPLEAYTQAW